jgi:hypothetical protein
MSAKAGDNRPGKMMRSCHFMDIDIFSGMLMEIDWKDKVP